MEQLKKIYLVCKQDWATIRRFCILVGTAIWVHIRPTLRQWGQHAFITCFVRAQTLDDHYWRFIHRFDAALVGTIAYVGIKIKPTVDFIKLLHKTYYPRIAPYADPCILLLFRFIRWSYRAVNYPFDRMVAYYMLYCRRHGIHVEEESLRARWLTDGWMYIMVFPALLYSLWLLIIYFYTRM